MNNFKTIKYIIKNKLLDFSIRHLRRKAKELFTKNDLAVKRIKNKKGLNEYLIDIDSLGKFQRIRAPKKTKTITNDSSKRAQQVYTEANGLVTFNKRTHRFFLSYRNGRFRLYSFRCTRWAW